MFARLLATAPLLPLAVAATVGIVADRYLALPSVTGLVLVLGGVVLWWSKRLALPWGLWLAFGGVALAYHHAWRHLYPPDDIGWVATQEPLFVVVRGVLHEEPTTHHESTNPLLLSRPRPDATVVVVRVVAWQQDGIWRPVSGRVRLTADDPLESLRVGDECEMTGWLTRPGPPLNPGGWDFESHLRDDRIRAELRVREARTNVVRLRVGEWSIGRMLGTVRAWSQRTLQTHLPPDTRPIAAALLLGDTAAMSRDDWERYARTGIIHVLAISGQHLVVLGAFLWFVLRLLGVPRRRAAVLVASVLLGYAFLTGGRPSAVRAAVVAVAVCGGILLRRPALPANTVALAWLVILLLNPTDLFNAGFQISFVCVAVLLWGMPQWFPPREVTPLEQLIDESRTPFVRGLRHLGRAIGYAYLLTAVLGLATAPLIMYWQNLVAPVSLLLGPVAILLTSVALVAGFMLLLTAPLVTVEPWAWGTNLTLVWCERAVRLAEQVPHACWYVGATPMWWLVGFYTLGVGWLVKVDGGKPRRGFFPLALALWTLLGLVNNIGRTSSDELRVTFLAVDHGACIVLQTPDDRVLLYDVGANAGPNVTKRHVAPFLWHAGIRHVDEVFFSHADLDHFNGLPPLLDRFTIGQVTTSPTFATKPTPEVRLVLEQLEAKRIPIRSVARGTQLVVGAVELTVLHPPAIDFPGTENARSLVLLIKHEGHTLLLTGDLEHEGLAELLRLPPRNVDVLLTPHHGSDGQRPQDLEALVTWCQPKLVVSTQGRYDEAKAAAVYRRRQVPYWGTWPNGAITVHSHRTGLVAATYRGDRMVVR